jgi:hypothetical protein
MEHYLCFRVKSIWPINSSPCWTSADRKFNHKFKFELLDPNCWFEPLNLHTRSKLSNPNTKFQLDLFLDRTDRQSTSRLYRTRHRCPGPTLLLPLRTTLLHPSRQQLSISRVQCLRLHSFRFRFVLWQARWYLIGGSWWTIMKTWLGSDCSEQLFKFELLFLPFLRSQSNYLLFQTSIWNH